MRVLHADEIANGVTAAELVPVVKQALAEVQAGAATVPERLVMPLPDVGGTVFVMPAYLPSLPSLTVKIVTVHEGNRARGLPTTQGQVLVLDPATGRLQGQLDGGMVTKLRTGAVAALATSVLALPDARTLAVIGTGEQAEGITEAILGLGNFRFEMVRVYSRDPGNRERFIRRMEARIRQCGFPTPGWHAATTAREALVDADVVVTATTASTPVVSAEAISAPCHINAVGAFRPDAAELAPELVGRARLVVVESRTAARREAGDLIQAADRGLLDWETVRELAEIAARPDDIRPAGGITVFKSVGVAALDAAVSRYILDKIVPGA